MIAMGFMQALYGLFNQATNTQKILWMDKTHYFEQATGTFVNPNHFCAYLIIIVCLIAGKLLATLESRGKKKKPPKLVTIVSSVYSIEALVLVILVLAILASKSMGGLLSLGAVVAAIYLLLLKKPLSKRILLAPTAMVIFTLASILTIDSQLIFQELGGLQQSIERRTELWTASARVVKEHWAFGIGGGAFYSMFTQYRDLDIGNNFYYYAHNDYIQFLAEFGLIGATLLLLFIVLTIKCNYRAIQNSNSIHSKTFGYSSILATVAVATHSIVDFPLQIPAYAVLYLVIISVNIPAYAKHIKISGNGTL